MENNLKERYDSSNEPHNNQNSRSDQQTSSNASSLPESPLLNRQESSFNSVNNDEGSSQ